MPAPSDPFVWAEVTEETAFQSFTIVALTKSGRMLMCGEDYVWMDITPGDDDAEAG